MLEFSTWTPSSHLNLEEQNPLVFSTFHFRSFDRYLWKGKKKMKHKKLFVWVGFVLILALISVIGVQAASPKTLYLDWRQVVPAGFGDPNMFGETTVSVNAGQARLCYTMRVFLYPSSLWPPTGAGIYKAPAGSNGPLVVDLRPDFSTESPSRCLSMSSALAHDIQRNPAQYYLLVTDSSHPDGAARAQLTK
jgi:hypothetical protein